MKTVKQWLEELPEPIRTQAFENNRFQGKEDHLSHEADELEDAINHSFGWDISVQGFKFWESIATGMILNLTDLTIIQKVEQWGRDRNIVQECPPIKQAYKTLEECGELIEAIALDDKEAISDAIGDIQVTLILQCAMQGLDYNECLEKAYEVIKDRKGKLIGGKFIKEEA